MNKAYSQTKQNWSSRDQRHAEVDQLCVRSAARRTNFARLPPICLCMIVRDEAPVIARCLRSVLRFISHWAIVDTGSLDETPDIVNAMLGDLPGRLIKTSWMGDFAKHRNESVSLARNVVGSVEASLLFIDADETLIVKKFSEFCRAICNSPVISWWVVDGDWRFRKLGIVHVQHVGEWSGSVHEFLDLRSSRNFSHVQSFAELSYGHDGFRRLQTNTFQHDESALKAKLADEEHSYRTSFFLARTYEVTESYELAAWYFRLAVGLSGRSRECRWQAQWGLGRSLSHFDQGAAALAFVTAHRIAPLRAEALVELAAVARHQAQHAEAMALAKAAINCPEPTATSMYDKAAYGWKAVDELCLASFALSDADGMKIASNQYKTILSEGQVPDNQRRRVTKNLHLLLSVRPDEHSE